MRVALFITCLVDRSSPRSGSATVEALKRAGVDVEVRLSQTCRGQMHINTGYPRAALGIVRNYVDTFAEFDAARSTNAPAGRRRSGRPNSGCSGCSEAQRAH